MSDKPQAVILAAGKSTRVYPLTVTQPKPLLPVANKPILAHNLDRLVSLVDEAVIIVGYRKDMIENHFGNEYRGIRLIYVEQKEQLGAGHAILQAEPFIRDRFVMMVGDDLCARVDIEAALQYPNSAVGKRVPNPQSFGVLTHQDGILQKIVEKPKEFVGDLASTGLHTFDRRIFECLKNIPKSPRGEYEAADGTNRLASMTPVQCLELQGYWFPIGFPWDLLNANEYFLESLEADIQGDVEPGAVIKGPVVIGKGTRVCSGAYIEGPTLIGEDCLIGPGAFIRPKTTLGNGVTVGHGTELKNSIVMNNSVINYGCYIADSVLAENVNVGASTVVANWRHDGSTVKSVVKSTLVDTGRERFGTVIGAGARIGIKTGIYPGRKIWPGLTTRPGEIIKNDITNLKLD